MSCSFLHSYDVFRMSGIFDSASDFENISFNDDSCWCEHSFINLGWKSSGPCDFDGFSFEIWRSSIIILDLSISWKQGHSHRCFLIFSILISLCLWYFCMTHTFPQSYNTVFFPFCMLTFYCLYTTVVYTWISLALPWWDLTHSYMFLNQSGNFFL